MILMTLMNTIYFYEIILQYEHKKIPFRIFDLLEVPIIIIK